MKQSLSDKLASIASRMYFEAFDNWQYQEMLPLWKEYFETTLRHFKFNKAAIDQLFEWGDGGHNWKALRIENTEFKSHTVAELADLLQSDADYCSDRMSLDRLFRMHWLYNQLVEKLQAEQKS